MINCIIGTVLAALIGLAIRAVVVNRKNGCTDCSNCKSECKHRHK